MRRQQLELVVIKAVERVLNGQSNEDSLVEFKSVWPDISKVRQLAGHANSARGDEIIWVIGVDEKGRRLTNPPNQDVAQWWAQIGSKFDGNVAPEMMDLVVPISEFGVVTALLFQTDRSPYVIRVLSGGAVEREVPIRDGTRTRSATRHELLRLLTPAASLPDLSILEAILRIQERNFHGEPEPEIITNVKFYINQPISASSFFPTHGMSGVIQALRDSAPIQSLTLRLRGLEPIAETTEPAIYYRSDGVMTHGPAVVDVYGFASCEAGIPEAFTMANEYKLNLSFNVAGAERIIRSEIQFSGPVMRDDKGN